MSSLSLPLRPATEREKAFSKAFLKAMPYCGGMNEHIRLTECSEMPVINARGGRDVEGWEAVFEADVQPDWLNGGGGLHGAAAAWLVDMCTGSAFRQLQTEQWQPWGPSVAIDMSYYAPAPAGRKLRITATVDRMGGQLCTARCLTGRRVASGMHTTMKSKGFGGKKSVARL